MSYGYLCLYLLPPNDFASVAGLFGSGAGILEPGVRAFISGVRLFGSGAAIFAVPSPFCGYAFAYPVIALYGNNNRLIHYRFITLQFRFRKIDKYYLRQK